MALAGLLEIADREFEAIQTEDAAVRANAVTLILEGRLGEVEVTPDSLRSYLNDRLGPDDCGFGTILTFTGTLSALRMPVR